MIRMQGLYNLIAKIFWLKPTIVCWDSMTIEGRCVVKRPSGRRLCKDGGGGVNPAVVQGCPLRWNPGGVDEVRVCRRDEFAVEIVQIRVPERVDVGSSIGSPFGSSIVGKSDIYDIVAERG